MNLEDLMIDKKIIMQHTTLERIWTKEKEFYRRTFFLVTISDIRMTTKSWLKTKDMDSEYPELVKLKFEDGAIINMMLEDLLLHAYDIQDISNIPNLFPNDECIFQGRVF